MDQPEARRVLGVGDDATADDVRRAFRRLVLEHHPDRSGGDGGTTRDLLAAYRALQQPAEPEPEVGSNPLDRLLDGATLELDLPPDEAFLAVLDAAADLGDVTYVDPEGGLVEVVLTDAAGGRTSLVLTLQGRAATGTTEVFGTFEPLA